MDETRTATLGEALSRAAAAGEPVQQKEATAIFLEALRLADQTQATLSSARTLLNQDGSMELVPGPHEGDAQDPFASVSGAYQLADELFRGAPPLALGRGDGTRAAPFATVRDMLCSLEFHLLVETGRGGPPPPARSDCRRAIVRLLAAAQAPAKPRDRPASAPEARRDLNRTFEEVAAAKREITDPFVPLDGRRGYDRAPARSAVEWSAAAPASDSPPAFAPPPAATAPQPAVNAPPPAVMTPPLAAMTPPPAVTWPPAATASTALPQAPAQGSVKAHPSRTAVRWLLVLALLCGASIAAAIAAAVGRSSPVKAAIPAVRAAAAASYAPAPGAPIDPSNSPRGDLPAPGPAPQGVRAGPVSQAQVPSRAAEKRAPGRSRAPADPAAEARARAKVQLGEDLLKSGRLFQALVAFREADQEQPLPESARRQGEIYRLQHDDVLAAAAYRRCLRLSPSPADAREVRGILDELRREAPAAP